MYAPEDRKPLAGVCAAKKAVQRVRHGWGIILLCGLVGPILADNDTPQHCSVQWPFNVAGWTAQQRWETVFDKLEERGIDYGKICRIWPYLIRLILARVELYITASSNLDVLIDELFNGVLALWACCQSPVCSTGAVCRAPGRHAASPADRACAACIREHGP